MKSKEDLKLLIQTIKNATGLTQEKIAVQAGYQPKTLTQILSKGDGLEAAYKQLEIVYNSKLNNSTKVDGTVKNGTTTPAPIQVQEQLTDPQAILIQQLLQVNRQLLESQAKRDQIETVYAEAHRQLTRTHAEMAHVLTSHSHTTKEILQEVKGLNINLDKSNLHFSRITESQMEYLERISDRLESELPTPPVASEQPIYTSDSK